jgi:hypothetical protein
MSRTAAPLLILAGVLWLIVGIAVSVLVAGALESGLAGDDPQRPVLAVASLLLGAAVTILGVSVTFALLRGRSRPATWPGGLAPNTLSGDALRRPKAGIPGPTTPVPPVPSRPPVRPGAARQWGSGGPPPAASPPPASSALTRAAGAQAPTRAAGALPPARPAGAATPSRPAGAPEQLRPPSRLPVVLGLVAGLVYLYQVEVMSSDVGAWFFPVFLLLMAGVLSAGVPHTQRGSSPLGGAIAATAPFAITTAAGALDGSVATNGGIVDALALFLVAWAAIAVGRVIGRAMGAIRGA